MGWYILYFFCSFGIFCIFVLLDNSFLWIFVNCIFSMIGSFWNLLGEKGVVYDCIYLKELY